MTKSLNSSLMACGKCAANKCSHKFASSFEIWCVFMLLAVFCVPCRCSRSVCVYSQRWSVSCVAVSGLTAGVCCSLETQEKHSLVDTDSAFSAHYTWSTRWPGARTLFKKKKKSSLLQDWSMVLFAESYSILHIPFYFLF